MASAVPREAPGSRLTLVGPGRAGRAFLRSWSGAGGSTPRVLALRHPGPAGTAASLPFETPPEGIREETDLLVLAVPDDAIASVAERLAPSVSCSFAFHLSGARAAKELSPLRRSGAAVGSLHPLRAFTGAPDEDWRGAFVAVEGDPPAIVFGEALAARFGASPHALASAEKPLYHAAATLAAGGTVALVSIAARLWAEAGIPESAGRPFLAALAAGALEKARASSFERGLTGAVERRDVATVRAHWEALAGRSSVREIYRTLAEEALRLTAGRPGEDELRSIFRDAGETLERKGR